MNTTLDYVKINTTAQRKTTVLEILNAAIQGVIFFAFLTLLIGIMTALV